MAPPYSRSRVVRLQPLPTENSSTFNLPAFGTDGVSFRRTSRYAWCARFPCIVFVVCTVFLLGIVPPLAATDTPERVSNEDDDERLDRVFACGPTCLYALLTLYGKEAVYEDLYRKFYRCDLGRRYGCSLADLNNIAEKSNLPCDVVRLTAAELRSLNRPVIGFQRVVDNAARSGHFVVVTAMSKDRIHVIDGDAGKTASWTLEYWDRTWTGYTLVPRSGQGGKSGWIAVWASVVFWVVLLATIRL